MILMAGREARPIFPVGPFYTKDCSLHGFAMFNAPAEEQQTAATDINRWLAEGRVKPRIDRVLPLAKAAEAKATYENTTDNATNNRANFDRRFMVGTWLGEEWRDCWTAI